LDLLTLVVLVLVLVLVVLHLRLLLLVPVLLPSSAGQEVVSPEFGTQLGLQMSATYRSAVDVLPT